MSQTYYERMDRLELRERAERLKEQLPSTVKPTDNVDSDDDVGSWEFAVDGNRATLNFMAAGAIKHFSAIHGLEIITLINPGENAELTVEIMDRERTLAAHTSMRREGDRVQIAEGYAFRLISGAGVVEYVIEYPGQKPVVDKA